MTSKYLPNGFPQSIIDAKQKQRKHLASLPIEEKLRIIVQMQHLAYEIARSSGRVAPTPWNLKDE